MTFILSWGGLLAFVGGVLAAIGFYLQSREANEQIETLRKQNIELFNQVITRDDESKKLQQRLIDLQVVGDSYPDVSVELPSSLPATDSIVEVYASVVGRFHLPELYIWVSDVSNFKPVPQGTPPNEAMELGKKYFEKSISFGPETLRVGHKHLIGTFSTKATDHLLYTVTAQWNAGGGTRWIQSLSYKFINGKWIRATQVKDQELNVILKKIDPDFPLDENGSAFRYPSLDH